MEDGKIIVKMALGLDICIGPGAVFVMKKPHLNKLQN